ncbi:helix-turn-helix domain-containing protein [Butyrivibrio sp. NC2007]|uniref:helix-turn-helix domain-containing protein n=1 Tax=Butyrivibrio sp. NC2007 TaxID=1280683 RepID=UPI0003B503BC|nr:helix-turn-helix transcriptional regulator [Butyrivibrio sp. NC2007]
MSANGPIGKEAMEYLESTSAKRVGSRIREIRMSQGMTMAQLGELLALSTDRIQKYENGIRKPKPEMINQIADALGVSALALVDPVISNYYGVMFALFEMEKIYGLEISYDKNDKVMLTIRDSDNEAGKELLKHLKHWAEEYKHIRACVDSASSDTEKAKLLFEYNNWKWTYPKPIQDKTENELKELRKAQLQEQINKLEQMKNALDATEE